MPYILGNSNTTVTRRRWHGVGGREGLGTVVVEEGGGRGTGW